MAVVSCFFYSQLRGKRMPGPAENGCDQKLAWRMSEISEVKCSGYSDPAGAQGKQHHTTEGMKDTSEPPQLTIHCKYETNISRAGLWNVKSASYLICKLVLTETSDPKFIFTAKSFKSLRLWCLLFT